MSWLRFSLRCMNGRWLLPALLVLWAAAGRAPGQDPSTEDPRWFRIRVPEMHVGVEAEGLSEDVHTKGDGTSTHDYMSVTPLVGGRVIGSIYHPNLLSFDVSGEGGMGWARDTVESPGFNLTRHEDQNLLRYLAQVSFLSAKPYNASFFAAQDHTYQNYDFFNTATVDSQRYGGRVAWTTETLSLSADMGYREERASGLTGTSDFADTYLNFNGIHRRESGISSLTYSFDDYNNEVDSTGSQGSVNQSVAVSDSETFGQRNQITASTGLSYSQYNYFNQQTENFNGTENVTINHLPNLDSFYNVNYNRSSQDSADTSLVQGMAGVRHRLYDSLISTLDVHGVYADSSSPGGSAQDDRYGLGLQEDYTKRVSSWGRLTIGGALVADHEDHQLSGSLLTYIDEPHQLFLPTAPNPRPTYLNNPRVILSTISIRTTDGRPLQEGIDYTVIPRGELVEIQIVPTSFLIPPGATVLAVLVSYQSESLSSSFEALNGSAQVRLDIFNIFGIYGRVNWLDNNAPPDALVETLTDLVGGMDATWRWARAGAEYEDFDSSFTQYTAYRLFQSFTFQLDQSSHLGLNFNQVFYHYRNSGHEDQYQFLAHFDTQITRWLSWNVEGGYSLEDVMGTQQTLAAARTGLSLNWGKLSLQANYQYNYQLTEQPFAGEQRDRNFFFVNLRRVF